MWVRPKRAKKANTINGRPRILGPRHLRRTRSCAPAAGLLDAEIYYHSPIKGGGDVAIARQIPIAGVTTKVSATLDIQIGVQNDLLLSIPSYVFATPVLGGQLQIGLLIPYGRNKVFVDQTIVGPMGVLGGPPMTSAVTGIGDFEPQTSLRWNFGVHNLMIYATGDVPIGLYNPQSLSNVGYGHGAIDGGGYTYFNAKTGDGCPPRRTKLSERVI